VPSRGQGQEALAPPRREPLDRRRILEAALRLIDEHGVAELSMRRLGAELGVQAMSLYRHLPNKQAVVEGVRDLIFEDLALLRSAAPADETWDAALVAMATAFRGICRRHPHALSLFATDVDRAYAAAASFYEPPLASLVRDGFTPDEAADAVRVVTRYVLSSELLTAAVTSLRHPLGEDEIDRLAEQRPLVGTLVRSLWDRPPPSLEDPGLTLIVEGLRAGRPGPSPAT
jgi:TetR/AcrR family transcriptional regulator, tetracycline repressor protein